MHFLHLPEGKVWDDAKQALEHTRVGADKGAVDLVQEHHELIFVTRQEEVALQQERMEVLLTRPGLWLQPTTGLKGYPLPSEPPEVASEEQCLSTSWGTISSGSSTS